MTAVALPLRRMVHVGVLASTGVTVGTAEQKVALAGEDESERSIAVADDSPHAIALQPGEPFALAYRKTPLFTVSAGIQGTRGIQGVPGPAGGSAVQRLAGETISALVAAYEVDGSVYALDYRDGVHAELLIGITLTSATTGEAVNLQSSGPLDDSSWSWVLGPVWVGIDGRLTQTPPDDGIDLLIGSAVSATRIALNLQRPITLE